MDEQRKQDLIKILRRIRDAHEALQREGATGKLGDAELLAKHVDLSVRTIASLDVAIVTASNA